MSRKAGFRASVLVAALALVLALTTVVAVAAGGVRPRLLSPNHKRIGPGRTRLVVDVPLRPARHGVFIAIAPKRKLDRFGHLKPVAPRLHRIHRSHTSLTW